MKVAPFLFGQYSSIKKSNFGIKSLILIILVVSFLVGLYLSSLFKHPNNISLVPAKPALSTLPRTDVSLKSNVREAKVGKLFSVEIQIDSHNTPIEAADIIMNFDPQYLAVDQIQEGNFFKVYPNKKIENGIIRISGIAVLSSNKFIISQGQGTIATIMLKALQPIPSTAISLDTQKTITASNGKNTLNVNTPSQTSIVIKE